MDAVDPVDPVDPPGTRPPSDVERGGAAPDASPDAGPDLDAIGAELATIETTLDQLAAGTYHHDETPPADTGSLSS